MLLGDPTQAFPKIQGFFVRSSKLGFWYTLASILGVFLSTESYPVAKNFGPSGLLCVFNMPSSWSLLCEL